MALCTTIGGGDHDHDDHKHHHHDNDHNDHDDHKHHHHHHDNDKNDFDDKHSAKVHSHGNDTINLGSGHDTLVQAGNATVHGSVAVKFTHSGHSATLAGGSHSKSFLHGTHHAMGSDTAAGAASHKMVSFVSGGKVSHDVIKNFVSGHDKLHVAGNSLSYLHSQGAVSISHGNTHISLHGGATTVELKGFSHLTSSDMSHKG